MRVRRSLAPALAALTATATLVAPLAATAADGGAKPPGRPVQMYPAPQGLSAPHGVNAADTTDLDTQVGTSLAVTDTGQVAVAFDDEGSTPGHETGLASSANNGLTFTDRGSLPTTAAGDYGETRMAWSRKVNQTYAVSAGDSDASRLQLFASADGGQTYAAPTQVAPSLGSGNVEDRPSIAVDNTSGPGFGNLYVCWTHTLDGSPAQQVYLGRSTDNGTTFTPSTGLTVMDVGSPDTCQVVVGADHSVYVFYVRDTAPGSGSPDLKIMVRRSTDRGATFATERTVADLNDSGTALLGSLGSVAAPQAAVPATGPALVAYNDVTGTGRVRSYYVRSTNKGGSWSPPAAASDETTGDQYQPTVAYSADGTTAMFGYYSTAATVTGATLHRQSRIGTVSGGTTLTLNPSFQLGPETATPASLGGYALFHSGHDEIVGSGTAFHSTWSDARSGNAFHARQLDVQYARVQAAPTLTDVALNFNNNITTAPGEPFSAVLTVEGGGGDPTQDVWVRMTMPTGLVAQSVLTTGGGRCYRNGRVLGCYYGSIAGFARRITVSGIAVATGNQRINAVATTSSQDSNTANNSTQLNVTVVPGNQSTTSPTVSGPVDLPDLSEKVIPFDVETDGALLRAQVGVRLTHTFDADLDLYLVSPEGTVVELSTDNGGSGDDYGTGTNDCSGALTTFSDSASLPVATGSAPFTGSFRPEGPLSDLAGEPLQGRWELHIVDDAGGDTGTLGCAKLDLVYN